MKSTKFFFSKKKRYINLYRLNHDRAKQSILKREKWPQKKKNFTSLKSSLFCGETLASLLGLEILLITQQTMTWCEITILTDRRFLRRFLGPGLRYHTSIWHTKSVSTIFVDMYDVIVSFVHLIMYVECSYSWQL